MLSLGDTWMICILLIIIDINWCVYLDSFVHLDIKPSDAATVQVSTELSASTEQLQPVDVSLPNTR